MDWEAEGLLEGLDGADRQVRIELVETLEAEGFTLEDIKRAHAEGELIFQLAGRAIQVDTTMTWEELVEQSGIEERLVARLVRAQGLPRAEPGELWYGHADLETLKASAEFIK